MGKSKVVKKVKSKARVDHSSTSVSKFIKPSKKIIHERIGLSVKNDALTRMEQCLDLVIDLLVTSVPVKSTNYIDDIRTVVSEREPWKSIVPNLVYLHSSA